MDSMVVDNMDISTHSLTRRLTACQAQRMLWLFISTHSLTRRLTVPYHLIT